MANEVNFSWVRLEKSWFGSVRLGSDDFGWVRNGAVMRSKLVKLAKRREEEEELGEGGYTPLLTRPAVPNRILPRVFAF